MMKTIFFFMGLTIGGLVIEVKSLRERPLDAQSECAYHEGMADGYQNRVAEERRNLKK
jgi:hypothetical protein